MHPKKPDVIRGATPRSTVPRRPGICQVIPRRREIHWDGCVVQDGTGRAKATRLGHGGGVVLLPSCLSETLHRI